MSRESDQTSNNDDGPFILAYRFRSERAAKKAYFRAQDAIFAADLGLSVYRFLLEGTSHVAALGAQPPESFAERLDRMLSAGQRTSLPLMVIQRLWERRAAAMTQGDWVEKHYRPGEQPHL